MRSINGRLLLVSAGLVVIVGVGAKLLHEIQVRRSAGILLELGLRQVDEGRPDLAVGYLTRYTKLAPHNADAQVALANALADVGRLDAAIKWYEQALLRDAGRHDARRRLVELSVETRQYSVGKSHIVDYLLPYTPEDAHVYYLLGLCHEGLGEYGEAISRLQDAIERDPRLVDAYARLATLLREQRKNAEDADAAIEQMVSANPELPEAYLLRSDYCSKFRVGDTVADVRKAVDLAPDDPDVLFRAARTHLDVVVEQAGRTELLDEAEQMLQKGVAQQPRFAGWYLGLAQVDRSRGRLDEAVAHIEEGLSAVPNDVGLQWNLADLMIQQGRVDEGMGIVARLRDQEQPKVPLEYLVALADVRRKRYVDAAERFGAIRGQMDEWPELQRQTEYWLGICYERLGEYGLQLTAFRNAAKIDPYWIPARQWLANALAKTGRVDEAITEYQELARLTGVPGTVYRELARLLVLRELQRRDDQRQWPHVLDFLDRAAKLDPESDVYVLLRAEVRAAQGDRAGASAMLQQGIKNFPGSLSARLALAALEQMGDNWDTAARMIDAAEQEFGDSEEIRFARQRYLIQRYGAESYDQLRSLEQQPLEGDLDAQQRWRVSLAAAYYTLGKNVDARRLWEQAAKEEPDNIRLRIFLFDLALSEGDDEQMRQLLSEIQRIERAQERPLWHYGEATRLIVLARKGDAAALEKVERLLETIRAARSTWSRIPLLEAEVAEIRGDYDATVKHYLAAIELGERSPTVIRRVVELLYRQRRYADADSVLRRFEATQLPITGELGRLAADVAFRVQDFRRAMQIAVQAIGDSEDYADLVWMAQLYSVMDQRSLAEEKFRAAIKRDARQPDAWVALVQHFARHDSPDKARRAMEALTLNVDPETAPYVEAICLRTLQDYPAALAKFDQALEREDAAPVVLRSAAECFLSLGIVARGEPVLQRLLAHPQASAADKAWARRNLAIIWVASAGIARSEKALALINENLAQNPDSLDDLRAKAICLQALAGDTNLRDALAIVDAMIRSGRASSNDVLLAYQLSSALGRKTDARRYLEQHTFENSDDPQSVARYAHYVLGNDELREAQVWINRLDRLCLDGMRTTTAGTDARRRLQQFYVLATGLRAQLLLKRNDATGAANAIAQRLVSEAPSGASLAAGDAVQLLMSLEMQTANHDERLAADFRSAVEATLRRSAPQSPAHAIALVLLLARQGKLSDAVAVWQANFAAAASDEFAVAAAALSAQPHLSPGDLAVLTARVESLPAAARSRTVLASLAQLLAFQGRHTEAIAVQREILAKAPQDASAMNNLACYLALSGSDRAEALRLIDAAISVAGTTAGLLDSRGMILLEMDRPEEALQDFERAIALAPTGPIYMHYAAACRRLGLDDRSDEAMSKARELGLDVNTLHPLERARYEELLKQAAL